MSSPTPAAAPTALVTGATSGLGLEFARQLAARGHDLVLVARDRQRLEQVAEELRAAGRGVEVLPADLGDRDQLATVEARVADPDRAVEVLVNNAGFGLRGRFADHVVAEEQAMLDVLVTAVMRLSHAAISAQLARGHGTVLNVASVAAFLPRGTYGAAKAWLVSFGRWASVEYAPRGVTVTTVCPGFVRTEFHERLGTEEGTGLLWMEAGPVVRQALDDAARGRTLSVSGRLYPLVVGLARFVPSRAVQRLQSLGR